MNLLLLSGDSSIARGIEGAFSELLRDFALHWARIDILTPHAKGAQTRQLYANVYVHPAPYHRALQPYFIWHKGRELLAQRPYDVVVSHDFGFFYNGIGARALLRGQNIPLISELHHIEGYPIASTWRERAWRVAAGLYLRWAKRRVLAFRAVNHGDVPRYLRALGVPDEQIVVLSSLYLKTDSYRPLPELTPIYDGLYVGRLSANKGIGLIVQALALVKQSHPQVKLALRGEGELRAALEAQIARLNLGENVVFLPRVAKPDDMPRLYQSARCLICASTVEGNPRVTAEAMACGVPVISTRVGIMPDLIQSGDNGYLVERSPESIAQAWRKLLDDEALRQRIGQAGRSAVLPYDARQTIPAYAQTYQALIARGRR